MLRGKLAEAYTNLATLRTQAEQYFQDNRTYIGFPCPAGAITGSKYFTYACNPAVTATTYTFEATGVASEGLDTIIFSINDQNVKATAITGGSPMANSGWLASASCWVRNKGGVC